MFCTGCGAEVREGAAFCVSCGAGLRKPPTGAPTAGPAGAEIEPQPAAGGASSGTESDRWGR
jgi:hypothetical protein